MIINRQSHVPSKGALRILRRLAYAGSLFSSLGAATVVEEQRRAIAIATKARDNARKLKASRRYHAAVESVVPVSEDGRVRDNWEAGLSNTIVDGKSNFAWARAHTGTPTKSLGEEDPVPQQSTAIRNHSRNHPKQTTHASSEGGPSSTSLKERVIHQVDNMISEANLRFPRDQVDPKEHKEHKESLLSIQDALRHASTKTAMGLFRDYMLQEGSFVDEALLGTARDLSSACKTEGSHDLVEIVLENITRRGITELPSTDKAASVIESYMNVGDWERAADALQSVINSRNQSNVDADIVRVAEQLCEATMQNRLFTLANPILSSLDQTGKLEDPFWNRMVMLCAAKKEYQQSIHIYKQFCEHQSARRSTYASVVNALVHESKLVEAEEILSLAISKFKLDSDLITCPARLITSTWHASGNLQKTKDLFARLKSNLGAYTLPKSLFNAIIQACVQANRSHDAQAYLKQMTEQYGLKPDLACYGSLMLASAYEKDWEAIHQGFRAILNDSEVSISKKRLAAVFNPILIEHFRSEGLDKTLQFLRTAIDDYGVRPDQYTSNFMITRFVDADDVKALLEWVRYVERFNLQFDVQTLRILLKRHWLKTKTRSPQLRSLYTQLERLNKDMVDGSLRRLIHDATAYDIKKSRLSEQQQARGLRVLQEERHEKRGMMHNARDALEGDMRLAMARREGGEAIQIYKNAMADGVLMSDKALALAVKASLEESVSGSSAALSLINLAKKRGINIDAAMVPLVIRKMDTMATDDEGLFNQARGIFETLERDGIPMSEHIVSYAASTLLNKQNPRAALNLLMSWEKIKPLSLVGMTVLLRSYSDIRALMGIRWTVRSVLKRNMPIDRRFLEQMKKARVHYISQYGNVSVVPELLDAKLKAQKLLEKLQRDVAARLQSMEEELQRKEQLLLEVVASVAGKGSLRGQSGRRVSLESGQSVTAQDEAGDQNTG
ncbi:MAG: hypothetical protein M1837_007320 [Sclerophora amabilis]|nr:MAG: hypothetical protein M1837_007320 [Sclerophora amabilis]